MAVLDAKRISNPFEYCLRGRGRSAAIAEIERLIMQEKCEAFVVFDLQNFFPSVKQKHLSWLELPKETEDQVVFFTRHAHLIHTSNQTFTETKPARHGLPQGAIASGRIASALLGRELCRLGKGTGIVTYVDDGVIGARTHAEAKEIAEALQTRLANLHGGPLGLKSIEVADIECGFPFLGYWIKTARNRESRAVRVTPSHSAKQKLRKGLFKRLRAAGPELDFEDALGVAGLYVERWLKAFPAWAYPSHELDDLHNLVLSWVDDYFSGFLRKPGVPSAGK